MVSLQHVSISGYLLGAVFELPSNAQHWSSAESRAGAAAVWRRNPAGDVSIMPLCSSTREKEKYILPGLGLTKLVFFCEFVEGQGKSSLKGEGLAGVTVKNESIGAQDSGLFETPKQNLD